LKEDVRVPDKEDAFDPNLGARIRAALKARQDSQPEGETSNSDSQEVLVTVLSCLKQERVCECKLAKSGKKY